MAAQNWLTTCIGLAAVACSAATPGAARAAAEVLQVRAAVHTDAEPGPDAARAGQSRARSRIVFDLSAPGPGVGAATDIQPVSSESGRAWTVRLDAPLSARAEAQLRALPRRIPGLQVSLAREASASISTVTLRFEKPTVLARHFLLPGHGGRQERLVLDFTPDTAPSFMVAAMVAAPVEVAAPESATPEPVTPEPVMMDPARVALLAAPPPETEPEAPPETAPQRAPATAPETGPATGPETGPGGESPLTLRGFVEAEGRWFPQHSNDGAPDRVIGSLAVEPTIEYSWNGGNQFLRFTGFARVDTVTEHRTHADVREAKYVGVFGPLELTVGVDRRFWGVTEAVHLVNILNQVDTLEDVDFEDYLGQPLLSAAYTTRFGTFSGFFMPYFRERLFPGREDRPNLPVHVNRDLTQYESGDNNWHPDWALRWSLREGPVDLGLSYFSGISREPQLLLSVTEQGQPQLIPRYNLIDQVGVDLQATLGAWLLKFEGIRRWDPVKDYFAFAAGFEYTFYGVSAAGADLGVLAEYLYDDRGKSRPPVPGFPPFSNVSPYDDDLFVGLRWSGNDIATTEILAGGIFDLGANSRAFVVEASRRLGANLRISLDGRFFTGIPTRDPLWILAEDDFLQLKIQWHF